MSFLRTLEQARDFLLLPPELAAGDVLQAARERQAEWKAKCDDPKSPARLKEGAARKLRELAPMLPVLEIEVDLDEIARAAENPRLGKNQMLRLCENVGQKIGALTKGEEKEMLGCRVEDLRDAAKSRTGSIPPLPAPSPPPPILPEPPILVPPPAPPPVSPPLPAPPAPSPPPATPPPAVVATPPLPERGAAPAELPQKETAPVGRKGQSRTPFPFPLPPRPGAATPTPFSPPRPDATPSPFPPGDATPTPFSPPPPAPPPPAAPKRASPPPQSAKKPEAGLVLKLVPRQGSLVTGVLPIPLHFVARPEFVIGRFSTEGASRADFSCPLAEKRVSRAHVTLARKGEEFLIQDGDGKNKSSNGSKLDDETLTPAAVPASFARERTISLGGIFALTAQHLAGEAPSGPTISSESIFNSGGRTMIIALVSGCMRFAAKTDGAQPASVVWLFTDASFGTAAGNAVPLPNSSLADKHGRVHFWQDGFWLENLRSGSAIMITDSTPPDVDRTTVFRARPLNKGEVVALRTGDVVKLGQVEYTVAIER